MIRLLGWLIALAGALAMLCGSAFAATTLQELQADVAACVSEVRSIPIDTGYRDGFGFPILHPDSTFDAYAIVNPKPTVEFPWLLQIYGGRHARFLLDKCLAQRGYARGSAK